MKIQSILVEGGSQLLQSFIAEGAWDEARIITNTKLELKIATNGKPGVEAPILSNHLKVDETKLLFDKIEIYQPARS
jgi:diaminohydroxyphosphoribosylaminopyrimidine deaminase/5-amino-6-(5-phosphoribosylamino)uracil reductase